MKAVIAFGRRVVDIPCTIEIEHTRASLHAHVELDGVDVEPGDTVQVHDAPTAVGFGEKLVCRRRATVVKAGWAERAWIKATALFELTELYEVSFTPMRLP